MRIRDRKTAREDRKLEHVEHVEEIPDYEALGMDEIDLDKIKAEIGMEEER